MLNRIKSIYQKGLSTSRTWINRLRTPQVSAFFFTFTLTDNEIIYLVAQRNANKINIISCQKQGFAKLADLSAILTRLVDQYSLRKSFCTWVLDPKDYQLFIMEALPVPDSEFQAAIRFKIKTVLNFPIEEAVIDKFSLPLQIKTDGHAMMTVVAAHQKYLQAVVDQVNHSGLHLQLIDIPELTLKNFNLYYETADKSTTLIYLQTASKLIITQNSELRLTRNIDFNYDLINNSPADVSMHLEKLALEIQRSFDYYQTQWRSQTLDAVFYSGPRFQSTDIASSLSEFLGVQVKDLLLPEIFNVSTGFSLADNSLYLPLIGSLLREKNNAQQKINLFALLPTPENVLLSSKTLAIFSGAFLAALCLNYILDSGKNHERIKQLEKLNLQWNEEKNNLNNVLAKYPMLNLQDVTGSMQRLQAEVEAKAKIVRLLSNPIRFSNYLLEIARSSVRGEWLTQISIAENGSHVTLKGIAQHQAPVNLLVEQLALQPEFKDIHYQIDNVIKNTDAQAMTTAVNFIISGKVITQ